MKRMYELITSNNYVSMVYVVMLLFILSACDTTNVSNDQDVTGELDIPAATLIESLDLSNSEAQQVADIMSKYDTQQPGRLWYVSAELQQTLSDDQKADLIASIGEKSRTARGVQGRQRGAQGVRGRRAFEGLSDPLTEEQKEQLKALQAEQKESMKALVEERRANTVNEEEWTAKMKEAREAMRVGLQGILTEAQLAELEAKREEMEAKRGDKEEGARVRNRRGFRGSEDFRKEDFQAAMIDALELTDEQQEQLTQLREEVRSEMEELRSNFDRENAQDGKEAMQTLHESMQQKQEAIFTERQQEVVAIHKALIQKTRSTLRRQK